jgi:uridine phosphorylase
MCKVLGLEAACFCGVIANRNFSEKPSSDTLNALKEVWAKMAVRTIENSLNQ